MIYRAVRIHQHFSYVDSIWLSVCLFKGCGFTDEDSHYLADILEVNQNKQNVSRPYTSNETGSSLYNIFFMLHAAIMLLCNNMAEPY